MSQEAQVAALTTLHDKLERAHLQGLVAFENAMLEAPTGIGFHEIDGAHVITRVSPEELRMLGYKKADMVGRPVWEFIVMQEAAQRAIDQKLKGTRDLKPFVRTFKRADGSAVAMLLLDRHIVDRSGEPVGIRTAMTLVPT